MISFDFKSKIDRFIDKNILLELEDKKNHILDLFHQSNMIGWTRKIDESEVSKIVEVRDQVKSHSKCLVVIGIGGSYLGSYAVRELFTSYFSDDCFPVIYAGTTLSSKHMNELLCYLETIDFSINVISKSGTTMETNITYSLIKQLMEKKYSKEELRKRIIITTDSEKGELRKEANKEGYISFCIPDDIGGRYSIMTAAHLLPLSFSIDIHQFIEGYYEGAKYQEEAYYYACIRRCLFDRCKYVESFCVYEEKMYYFTEWLKQLFGETEGKNGKGILPISMVHTRDLHSLGQFIQDGNKIVFETFIKVNHSDFITYHGQELHQINKVVLDSVMSAHYSGGVPCGMIQIDSICENTIGELMYFFLMSACFSGFLFDVNPFDQPGVEVYKREIKENLK